MGTCTIIAIGSKKFNNDVKCFVPIKHAFAQADGLKAEREYSSVRVYAESRDGGTLTLIYVAK